MVHDDVFDASSVSSGRWFGAPRVEGSVWSERAMLLDILVTQAFVFDQQQLAGITKLVVTIVLWLMVRSALRAEREREVLAADEPPSARPTRAVGLDRGDSASPASAPAP